MNWLDWLVLAFLTADAVLFYALGYAKGRLDEFRHWRDKP